MPSKHRIIPRQKELISLLIEGYNNRDIAKAMSIGERTVKSHISMLCKRYGIPLHHNQKVVLGVMAYKEYLGTQVPKSDEGIEVHLTPRELEVLKCVHEGLTNKEIGHRLNLTEGSVKNYCCRQIFDKIGTDSRLQAALWYERKIVHSKRIEEMYEKDNAGDTSSMQSGTSTNI